MVVPVSTAAQVLSASRERLQYLSGALSEFLDGSERVFLDRAVGRGLIGADDALSEKDLQPRR